MALRLNPIGHPFIELLSVDSTNNYAMAKVHAGMAQHGTAVFALEQTAGKGQRSKVWLSAKGLNVILSVVIAPAGLSIAQSALFSKAMALGACRFFNKYAGEETCIKWPNDLYWRDRKAGGILIENVLKGAEWKYAVVGIGININQTHFDEVSGAVSLKQITGKDYNTVKLAQELCTELEGVYQQLAKHKEGINEAYHKHLYKIDKTVKLKKENRLFDACIKGVNAAGQLVVQTATEEIFDVGTVTWVHGNDT